MGNVEHLLTANNYTVAQTAISVNNNNEIIGEPSYGLKWSYASNQFKNADNPSVYVSPRYANSEYHVLNSTGQNLSFNRNNNSKWAIYTGNNRQWNNLHYEAGEFRNSRNTSNYD